MPAMRYDPNVRHRRSIRLKWYDYASPGAYFVTLCTQGHRCLFGEVVDGLVDLNDAGWMVERWWNELPRKFSSIQIDTFVVMPNHFHGIIVIVGGNVQDRHGAHTQVRPYERVGLGRVVQWFKTMTTNAYMHGVHEFGWPRFQKRLWQRNYFEHVARNEDDLLAIREYVVNNPARWLEDPDHPTNVVT
jgi:putative transposase